MVEHYHLTLPEFPRGFHLITNQVISSCSKLPRNGVMNVFIQHTSASLSINENADPSVRDDMEAFINRLVPENLSYFTHTFEGSDDMPAHIKASLIGSQITIPIVDGQIGLGTWQGIYLGEHRNRGGQRRLTISIYS